MPSLAQRRPRREGHWAGVEAIRRLVDGVLGLEHVGTLTVYAMSIENLLRRPADEVEWLLALFDRVVADEEAKLRARGVQLRCVRRQPRPAARVGARVGARARAGARPHRSSPER